MDVMGATRERGVAIGCQELGGWKEERDRRGMMALALR